MARKNLSAIETIVRQKLQDECAGSSVALTWEKDELNVFIDICLREISEASPYMVREVLTTIANSRVLDVSDIEDLLWIEKVEYPIGSDPPDYRNILELDAETVEIDTSLTPAAGGSGVLAGTVTFTHGSAAITGVATAFSTALSAGYLIKKSTGTRWYRVYSIESDTALTLAEPCLETTGADTVNVTQYCYEAVYLFCAKLHQLTEETSTLTALLERPLILGVAGSAAISKSRSLINKVNIGGAATPNQMQTWGINQLTLYRQTLLEINEPRVYQDYPRD